MVSKNRESALLPAGITDGLPPDAAHEARVLEQVMRNLAAYGYERVKPPLVEFEESLIGGLGGAVTHQTFRLMDPVSQRMMGLRADMTPQIARIAATRLAGAPRPLRLSYAGQVVRVKGSQLRAERQFTQVGAELIGAASPEADAETICLAAESLAALGIGALTIDLGMPTLVAAVCADLDDDPARERLRLALDRKDTAAVRDLAPALGGVTADAVLALMAATGPAAQALERLAVLDLGAEASRARQALGDVVGAIRARSPELSLTVDPVENRGFEYHTGVTYTLFATGARGELGRGGRYPAPTAEGPEPATGFSLFMDTIMRTLDKPAAARRLFVPHGAGPGEARRHRSDGWIVIEGLNAADNHVEEARRLGCTHLAASGGVRELGPANGG